MTLASVLIFSKDLEIDRLVNLISEARRSVDYYKSDSIKEFLKTYHHLYLCNRLYLLNLATIYTTGFECPNSGQVMPELLAMMEDVKISYLAFNQGFSPQDKE